MASALVLAAYIGEARSARDAYCCGERFGSRSGRGDLRRRGIRTCFISCFVFSPAPYQAPVTAVAVTPAVRIMVRTLGALDMVPWRVEGYICSTLEKGEGFWPRNGV